MQRITCHLLSLLASTSALAAPLLSIGTTPDPPVIDGRLDDAAWKHAIVVSDFLLLSKPAREPQQTEVRAVYDADALYLSFRCHEMVLDPMQQRLHEFRSQVSPKTHDGRVWNDDSIEVFLSPSASGRPYYHFIVNSLGARYDGKGKDKGWDVPWEAAGARSDRGHFSIEMRIPFSSLDAQPKPGRMWRVQFCRNRQPKDGFHSAWPRPVGGYHEPGNFARLRFVSRQLPEVRFTGFADFAGVGNARITSTGLRGCSAALHLGSASRPALSRVLGEEGCNFGPLRAALAERITSPGQYEVRVRLVEPDGKTVLLEAPPAPWLLGTYRAKLTVMTKGNVQVAARVNGQPIDLAAKSLRLRPGTNLIAFHATRQQTGAVRTALEARGRQLTAGGWRAHAGPLDDWGSMALDDRAWSLVEATDDGWLWQDDAREVVLRRWVSIPAEGYCWPGHEPTHLARGAAQMLTFELGGSGDPDDFWFEITLPKSIRLVDPLDRVGKPRLTAIRHDQTQLPDSRVRHRLDLSNDSRYVNGFGGELQWCANEDGSAGVLYHRLLRFAGSSDWRTASTVVRAPADAKSARVWFLKWPRHGVSGVLDFDDVSLRKVGADVELVSNGGMEHQFKKAWATGRARRRADGAGNHFVRMDAKRELWSRQIWFRTSGVVPIEGGCEYVFSCRARWRDMRQARAIKGQYPLVIQVDEEAPEGPAAIAYGWASGRGSVTTLDHDLHCVIGPPIHGRQPKEILLMNWPAWAYSYPLGCLANAEQLQAMADQWYRCGFNVTHDIPLQHEFSAKLRNRLKLISTLHWNNSGTPHERAIDSYLAKHEHARATTFSGSRHPKRACPSFLLGADGEALRRRAASSLAGEVRKLPCDIYATDYEAPISSPPTICFDERCISGFRQYAGIGSEAQLTPKILIDRHIDEWTEFHLQKNLGLVRLIRAAVREARPEAKYFLYSGYHCDRTKKHYGVDWGLMRDAIDIGSAGYGRNPPIVADTVRALGDVPLVGGVIEYRKSTRPHTLEARVLRRVLDCRGGAMSWYDTVIDARWQRAFAKTSVIAAEFEDLIKRGKRNDGLARVTGQFTPDEVCVYDGPKRRLVALFNERAEAKAGRIEFLDLGPAAKVCLFPSGRKVKKMAFDVRLEGRTYRVYEVVK